MAEANETINDIIAEMRNRAKRPDFVSQDVLKSCADMLDAAHKRECGNVAKLREALKLCLRGMCGYCRMDAEARGMTTECVNGCEVMLGAKAALDATEKEGGAK